MSYLKAKECFKDALNYIKRPTAPGVTPTDRYLFDLANGLTNLTKAVEADIEAIRREIRAVRRSAG